MILAASTLCASQRPLREALPLVTGLGFDAIDLPMQEGWAHVDPSALADDPAGVTGEIRDLLDGARVVALNAGTGATGDEEVRRVAALLALARELDAPVVTLPPAPLDGSPLAADIRRAARLVRLADGTGVTVTFETHTGTTWEDPRTVQRYLDAVPGLGVTLDPSHYTTGRFAALGFAELLPAVRHIHLRSGGSDPSEIQLPAGEGVLPIPDLLRAVVDAGYAGDLAVEYVDVIAGVDAVRETARMAEIVRPLLAGDDTGPGR